MKPVIGGLLKKKTKMGFQDQLSLNAGQKNCGMLPLEHSLILSNFIKIFVLSTVLDLGLISIASLGPRASTKVESHVNFTESQKVSQP